MLRLRPCRKNDSHIIVNWCQDEKTFYEWNAGFKEKGQCSEYELCGEIWKCIELELNQSFIF